MNGKVDTKSTTQFINTVTKSQEMAVGRELVRLVDTPGFSDTELSDTEILKRIAGWLQLS